MKIGVLELLSEHVSPSVFSFPHDLFVVKQYASIMPQAVSAWCRRLGHEVCYATYYGRSSPEKLLPKDLDLVFISCFSRGSGLAYALARLMKKENPKLLTVLGGPHAKQFSADALRFFDLVVKNCDFTLIKELLKDLPRNGIVTTDRPLSGLPGIEERLPEIQRAYFWHNRPAPFVFIPILSSIGCPYACDFCVDWNTPYTLFPLEDLRQDLAFAARHFPQVRINFYDPNFGVEFDRVMEIIEGIDHPKERWFLTEGSLDSLTRDRLRRMEQAGCLCVIPGIESFNAYTKKTGMARPESAMDKLEHVVDRFRIIHDHIPITQANLLFGLDTDRGDEPAELIKEFIRHTPWVSHSLNIPAPFGETPLFRRYLRQGRILETLPFAFYCKPFLATTLKHYDPVDFYEKLIHIFTFMVSTGLQLQGIRMSKSLIHKGYQPIRAASLHLMIRTMKKILKMMKTDPRFLAFHQGRSKEVPEFYHRCYDALLGPFKELVPRKDRIPVFDDSGTGERRGA